MKITERKAGEVWVVEVEGRLDTTTADEAETYFGRLGERGATRLLLHLGRLEFISSAGLRVLLIMGQGLDEVGGQVRFCGLNPTVAQVFRISGFDAMFKVYGTEAEALQGF